MRYRSQRSLVLDFPKMPSGRGFDRANVCSSPMERLLQRNSGSCAPSALANARNATRVGYMKPAGAYVELEEEAPSFPHALPHDLHSLDSRSAHTVELEHLDHVTAGAGAGPIHAAVGAGAEDNDTVVHACVPSRIEIRRHDSNLKQNTLSLVHCVAMSVTMMAPTASIFFISGQMSRFAGASAPFVVLLSSIFCVCLGLTVLQFSRFISSSGSFYSFIVAGLGDKSSFVTMWLMLLGYGLLGVQASLQIAAFFSDVILRNTGFYFHWAILVVVVTLVIGTMSFFGIQESLRVSMYLAAMEMCVIITFSFIIIGKAESSNDVQTFGPSYSPTGISGVAHALVFGTFLFCGFEGATSLGEETTNPKRNIGLAVIGSLVVASIYICLGVYAMIIAQGVQHASDLANVASPADYLARTWVGDWFASLVDIAGCISTWNATVGYFNYDVRLLYACAKKDLLGLSFFSRIHATRHTPLRAIVAVGSLFAGASLLSGLLARGAGTDAAWAAFGWLGYIGTLPIIVVYMTSNVALFVYMRTRQPELFSLLHHAALPACAFLAFVVPLVGNFYPDAPASPYQYFAFGLVGWLVLGLAISIVPRSIVRAN